MPVSLQLAGVDYTTNPEWFTVQQGTATEQAMKSSLHQGTMADFNVYSGQPRGAGGELIAGFTQLPMFSQVRVCDGFMPFSRICR